MEEAYWALREGWAAGDRDRERALYLLYLAWWHWAEPDFLTGLSHDPDAVAQWHEIFEHFGGEMSSDAELLYVAAIMAEITPWAFGNEKVWKETADTMRDRSLVLKPDGFCPEEFGGRGNYGDYFAHQSRVSRK